MAKAKLSLHVPANHTITLTSAGATDSLLLGQLSFSSIPPQCVIEITLARVGRWKQAIENEHHMASKILMNEFGFMGLKEQKQEQFAYDSAEKLSGCLISPPPTTVASKTIKCGFELPIPSYLPATATLPSVDISYAIFARCILPNGKVSQCSQGLRIIRKSTDPIRLEPSRTVSFPESPFAVRASFDAPELGSKNTTLPIRLHLQGLNLPVTNLTRANETRWLVPREIKWELEETAVLITGFPDATGHLPMSTAQRVLEKRKLAAGKEKLRLKYPFTRPGNTTVHMLNADTEMEIPFTVTAPHRTELGDSTALAVAGGHVLHTVRSSSAPADGACPQRFALYLEYTLHIWLRIGEDVFDEASGDLVNRKMDEMAYTVLCPLTTRQDAGDQLDENEKDDPLPVIPPVYDGACEQPPPMYTSIS